MRFVDFKGYSLPLTIEEQELMSKFPCNKKDLTERECVIANDLVRKDLLIRKRDDGQLFYKTSKYYQT